MTSSEFPVPGRYIAQIAEGLHNNSSIGGRPYGNVVVTTTHPDFTDVFDPGMNLDYEAYTLYWPGGRPGNRGDHDELETIVASTQDAESKVWSPADFASETMTIRNALLGASIGQAALGRVPPDITATWERVKQTDLAPILLAEARCVLLGLPLAVCQTSRVVQSAVAPVDARIMHLWYPGDIVSPKPVLARLKKAVRNMIEQETI